MVHTHNSSASSSNLDPLSHTADRSSTRGTAQTAGQHKDTAWSTFGMSDILQVGAQLLWIAASQCAVYSGRRSEEDQEDQ